MTQVRTFSHLFFDSPLLIAVLKMSFFLNCLYRRLAEVAQYTVARIGLTAKTQEPLMLSAAIL